MELASAFEAVDIAVQKTQLRTLSEREGGEAAEGTFSEANAHKLRTVFDEERRQLSLLCARAFVCQQNMQRGKRLHDERRDVDQRVGCDENGAHVVERGEVDTRQFFRVSLVSEEGNNGGVRLQLVEVVCGSVDVENRRHLFDVVGDRGMI